MKNKIRFKYLKTKHSWHLVDPSPWPLVASLGAFFMTSGTVLYMNKFLGGGQLAFLGFFIILYVMYTWWRDIVREATFEDQHTVSVQRGLRLGMILFIVSEIMFFFAFFWAFFHVSLTPSIFVGNCWPPLGIQTLNPWHIPYLNTCILFLRFVNWSFALNRIFEIIFSICYYLKIINLFMENRRTIWSYNKCRLSSNLLWGFVLGRTNFDLLYVDQIS